MKDRARLLHVLPNCFLSVKSGEAQSFFHFLWSLPVHPHAVSPGIKSSRTGGFRSVRPKALPTDLSVMISSLYLTSAEKAKGQHPPSFLEHPPPGLIETVKNTVGTD